jgi:putative MATE family efflux protein
MREKKKKTMDMTRGPILRQIILFALPLLGSSLVQLLYNTVDLLYIGQILGKNASAAVGASSMMVTCLVGLFGGLAVGAGVVTANAFGAKDRETVGKILHTSAALSILSGALVFGLGYVFAPAFITAMGTPEEIIPMGVSYLRIYFFSALFIVSYNMGAGVIRAMGDSFMPLMFQLAGGIVNVIMDGVFLLVFRLGVEGVAWATFFSQGMAALLTVVYLFRRIDPDLRIRVREIRIHGPVLGAILRVGIPSGFQTLVIALSNVVAQYFINGLGTDAVAAFTAYFRVELPIYFPIVAFGQAATTFVGQNLGARQPERAARGTRVCLYIGCVLTVFTSILLMIFSRQAAGLFVRDAGVAALCSRIMLTTFPFYCLYVVLQVYGDSIKGAGKATPPTVIILMNITLIRSVLLMLLVPSYPDVKTIAWTYPITWGLTAAEMVLYYRFADWRSTTLIKEERQIG